MDTDDWANDRLRQPGPWSPSLARLDLRYWDDPIACQNRRRPSIRELSEVWGWSRGRVSRFIETSWRDKYRDKPETSLRQQRDKPETTDPQRSELLTKERDKPETSLRQQRDKPETARKGDTRAITDTDTDTRHKKTENTEIPAWLRPWLRKHRSRLGLADDLELVGGLSAVLEAVTGRVRPPTKTPAGPVLRLWSAMLDEPDAVGDALGVSLALDLADLVRLSVLLANAARDCPASIFARDLRAEGWPEGTDRHRVPAAVCRLTPPARSSGADYLRRLEVAHRWHEAGRPLASWPPEEEQRRRRSSSQQPRSIAERIAGSAGRSLLLLPGGIDESR